MKRKKVGTITLAIGLIILGLVLFANNFTDIGIKDIHKYWPVLLIGLGVEMIAFMIIYRHEEGMKLRVDGLCIAFIIVTVIFSNSEVWFNFSPKISFNPFQGNVVIDGIKYSGTLSNTVVKDEVSKSFNISKVNVRNSFGDVKIQPHDKPYIKVEANITVKYNNEAAAKEYIKDVVRITEGEQTNIYCVEYNGVNKDKYGKANVDFVVYVPKDIYAEATNSFGNIDVQGVTKDVVVSNQHGDVIISNIGGAVEVKTSFGDIDIKAIGGKLNANNQHGDIEADTIGGRADMETSFGELQAKNVSGELIARNSYGKITAQNVKGDAQIKTSFGDVEASYIDGNTVINDNNGTVEAKELKGNAEIKNSFGKIYYNSSNLNNAEVYAKTSFGSIKTDLPLNVSKAINDQSVNGRLGDGKYKIELVTNNGEIEIR